MTKTKYATKIPGAQVDFDLSTGEWVITLEDGREVRHFNKHIAEKRAKWLTKTKDTR